MMAKRVMGKASFAHIQDRSGRIQLFLQRDRLPEGVYASFKKWDIGDIVGVTGQLFKTRTDELSVRVDSIRLLTKSLRPLPEKFHGLTNTEERYRQRYVDLIVNQSSREVFQRRSTIIHHIRNYFVGRDFLEVETPMMHPIPGGATRPSPLLPTTIRSIWNSICGWRRSYISSALWSVVWKGCLRSIEIFEMRASAPAIIQNSPCWSFIRPMRIIMT